MSQEPVTAQTPAEGDGAIKKPPRRYRRIADMQGGEKKLRIFNLCFAVAIIVACVVWMVYRLVTMGLGDKELRYLTSLGIAIVCVIPFVLERLFRFNFSGVIMLIFLTFLLFAGFIGSGLGMYVKWDVIYYDKIVHGIFGYLACIAGLYLFCKLGDYRGSRAVFIGLVCFAVSLCCASVWEIWEFSCDRLLGSSAQGVKVWDGLATVADTMGDIIANFIGALVFTGQFILHRVTKKNLMIGSMVNDFTLNRSFAEEK